MENSVAIGLTAIVLLGVGAQWLAWRFKLPAILLLLLTGFVAGPFTGFLDPDALFDDLLFPMVSLSVGLVLFEGGLSLRLEELRTIRRPLFRLVLAGAAISWVITTLAALTFLGLELRFSLLLGAILVVTGPTVIGPLLRQIRPTEPVNSILKWEGILIDPLGATLALLVFEAIQYLETGTALETVTLAILRTLLFGGFLGLAAGATLAYMLQRYWVPDFLQNAVCVMLVLLVFTASNTFQHESGLLAVTVMGIYLANQRRAEVRHIVEFKETLRVLLIAGLFIVLAARLEFDDMLALPLQSVFFLAAVILIARPLSVLGSTFRSGLQWNERLFLCCMAPRGIVAAAVSSIFALRLSELGYVEAEIIAPATFLVIAGTVMLYGLASGPAARALGVAQPNPRGLALLGGHPWARALAATLQQSGVPVLVCDTNHANVVAARMAGLTAFHGNVLAEQGWATVNLSGIGGLLALTPNNETNALACKHFEPIFGRSRVFQLVTPEKPGKSSHSPARHLRGRGLFGPGVGYSTIFQHFESGSVFKSTSLTEEFNFAAFKKHYGAHAIPLLVIKKDGVPEPLTDEDSIKPMPGHSLISLVDPQSESPASDKEA